MTAIRPRRAAARNSRGRFDRGLEAIERDRKAVELITQGWTYQQAAEHLGYSDRGDCHRAVQRTRYEAARLEGTSEDLRQQQLAEMQELRKRLWDRINNPPPAISRTGKIVTDDDGNPVPDAQATAADMALLVRVSERVARIRGTDAPHRSVSLTGRAGPGEILAWVESINPEDLRAAVAMMQRRVTEELREREQHEQDARQRPAIAGTLEADAAGTLKV